jgi:hypothetical protein
MSAYFVTIVTKNRECLFGNIVVNEMILNDAGNIVQQWYLDIPNHFPNVKLDAFIIMPNHHPPTPVMKNNHIQTNSVRNPKIWHPLFGVLKLV